jgi:hypothetical protein
VILQAREEILACERAEQIARKADGGIHRSIYSKSGLAGSVIN